MVATPATKTEETGQTKRPRGRPATAGGTGGFKPVMVTLYQEQLDIAARIHPQRSVAVRMALEAWGKANPK